jgi:hypothetical protein
MKKHSGSRGSWEAEFFLGQLAPNYMKERKFDFFLSAFVGSARAIAWVMKSEYGKVPGWKAWYQSREPTPEEASLLKGTNALRTRLTKQEALRTTERIQLSGVKLSKADYDRVNSMLRSAPDGGVPRSGLTRNCRFEGQRRTASLFDSRRASRTGARRNRGVRASIAHSASVQALCRHCWPPCRAWLRQRRMGAPGGGARGPIVPRRAGPRAEGAGSMSGP